MVGIPPRFLQDSSKICHKFPHIVQDSKPFWPIIWGRNWADFRDIFRRPAWRNLWDSARFSAMFWHLKTEKDGDISAFFFYIALSAIFAVRLLCIDSMPLLCSSIFLLAFDCYYHLSLILLHYYHYYYYRYVFIDLCVCVCVCEREREKVNACVWFLFIYY